MEQSPARSGPPAPIRTSSCRGRSAGGDASRASRDESGGGGCRRSSRFSHTLTRLICFRALRHRIHGYLDPVSMQNLLSLLLIL